MSGTIYLYLLILCGIWSQGLIETFADEEIKESSGFLIRQKRVISSEANGARVVRIEEHPYIVHIKRLNRFHCVGTILSHNVVISSAICAQFPLAQYKVNSKSSSTAYVGAQHSVVNIIVRKDDLYKRNLDGIALLTISPPIIQYTLSSKNIQLHEEPLLPNTLATVSGWGCSGDSRVADPGTTAPRNLRTIEVPIISHQECVRIYRNYYPITDKDICTFHPQRYCGHTDGGAPLVIDNLLVGIFLRTGPVRGHINPEYPGVYALLQHAYYRDWIRAHI